MSAGALGRRCDRVESVRALRGPDPASERTPPRDLPFHGYNENRLWIGVVALAADLLTWMQTLAVEVTEPACREARQGRLPRGAATTVGR